MNSWLIGLLVVVKITLAIGIIWYVTPKCSDYNNCGNDNNGNGNGGNDNNGNGNGGNDNNGNGNGGNDNNGNGNGGNDNNNPTVGICQILVEGHKNAPIVISSTNYSFIYPPTTNKPGVQTIVFTVAEPLIIACPGGFSSPQALQTPSTSILAICVGGQTITSKNHPNQVFDYSTIYCAEQNPIMVINTAKTCGGSNGVFIENGILTMDYDNNQTPITYLNLVENCFDKINRIPFYTYNQISKSIGFSNNDVETLQSQYIDDGLFQPSIDYAQVITIQQTIIYGLLGVTIASQSDYTIDSSCASQISPRICDVVNFAPLTNKKDFCYQNQQYSSYRYYNTVPVWTITQTMWSILETSVINYSKQNQVDLDIYTGTYGVASLKHKTSGLDIDLYLYNQNGYRAFSVPRLVWKLVYHKQSQEAVVFIAVNNPFLFVRAKDVVCVEISDSLSSWKNTIRKDNYGYLYACSYDDAVKIITQMPVLKVNGVLI